MTRACLTVAGVAALFALGTFTGTGKTNAFVLANLAVAGVALASALFSAQRGWSRAEQRPTREMGMAGLWLLLAVFAGAMALRWAPDHRWDLRPAADLQLAQATLDALASAPAPLRAVLVHRVGDPRIGETRRLLRALSTAGPVELFEESVREDGEFDSNTVLLEAGGVNQVLSQPSEGALYEALARLSPGETKQLATAVGLGEGNLSGTGPSGYSGLKAALATEGYQVVDWVAGLGEAVPVGTDTLLVINPQKPYSDEALAEIEAFIHGGGRAALFVQPEHEPVLASLLDTYGVKSSSGRVLDPKAPRPPVTSLGLICQRYGQHPIVRALDVGHVTFFPNPAALTLRKAQPRDQLLGIAFSSIAGRVEDATDARNDFLPMAAAVRLRRSGSESRLAVFGDAEFVSNRWLRTGYNLDLVMNAFAWLNQDERLISLRAKAPLGSRDQEPVLIGDGLTAFLSVGLLVPEVLLMFAAALWFRQRSGGAG